MKMKLALALLGLSAFPAIASASVQEHLSLWEEPQEVRPGRQEQGGEVAEFRVSPRSVISVGVYGRMSFPGDSQVTIDNLLYSDFFDIGYGVSAEIAFTSYVTPQWGVGGYLEIGWDQFNGQTLNFLNGDVLSVGNWDQTSVIVGGKFLQRLNPLVTWEGRLGIGWVHYDSVKWSGVDTGVPFSNEELFRAINRAIVDLGFRVGIGGPHFEVDLGFGFRYMGAAARGKDVTSAIDPDLFYTFTMDLGLNLKF
jgi:hypothetical protein